MLGLINSLAAAKIIKTIGDGLKLTNAGKLSVDINPETMEFKSGKVSAKATSINYSTTEQNSGKKWIDGKDVYVKTLNITNPTVGLLDDIIADQVISIEGLFHYNLSGYNEYRLFSDYSESGMCIIAQDYESRKLRLRSSHIDRIAQIIATVYYTKVEEE